MISFVWRVTLCIFGFAELTMHSEMKRKTSFPFAFLSFFVTLEEIAGFLCIKAMQRIEKIQGSCSGKRQSRVRIRDRSQFNVLL